MAMDSVKDEDAPAPSENEPTQDEASWAIATAESLQARGDIANAVVFLASDESRAMTGQIMSVDSGVTIS